MPADLTRRQSRRAVIAAGAFATDLNIVAPATTWVGFPVID